MNGRRFRLSTSQIIGLSLIGAILLWNFLNQQFVLEALLEFGMAGVVPGTSIVLSPGAVILVVVGTFIFICLLVFCWPLFQALWWHEEQTFTEESARLKNQPSLPLKSLVSLEPVKPQFAPVAVISPPPPSWASRQLASAARRLGQALAKLKPLGRQLQQGWQRSRSSYSQLRDRAQENISLAWLVSLQRSLDLWQRAEPYLWRFNDWLERQVLASRQKLIQKFQQYENTTIMLHIMGQYRQTFQKLASRKKS